MADKKVQSYITGYLIGQKIRKALFVIIGLFIMVFFWIIPLWIFEFFGIGHS